MATFTGSGNDRQDIVVSNQTNHADAGAALVLATHGHDFIIEGQSSAGGSNITFHRAGALMATIGMSQATFGGDITVSGGDITLGGTGRIQGIDTVSASTDAASKAYVDGAVIANTDTQDLSISGRVISLTNGGSVTVPETTIPTIPSGNQIIDWTVDQGSTNIHTGNYNNTDTVDMGSGFIVANNGGTSQFTIVEDNALRFAGTGATTVAFNSTTKKVTIDSPAETYTAHESISQATSNLNNSGRTYIQDITLDSNGHVTAVGVASESDQTSVSGSSGSCTGNAATATTATNISATSVSDSTEYFGCFVTGTGTQGVKVASGFKYNPSTDILSAGKLSTDTIDIVENNKNGSALMTLTGQGSGNASNIALLISGDSTSSQVVKMKMQSTTSGDGMSVSSGKLSYYAADNTFNMGHNDNHAQMAISINSSDVVSMKNQTTFTNGIEVTSGTNSTSKTTGTVKVTGGVGIAKTLNVGEDVVAYASSDKRYKDNLQAITNPIDKVKSLTGYTFTWNDKHEQFNGNNDIGVVAQEVEKILPEIVDTRDDGYKAVKYEKMVALLIEAVKDQQAQIDDLKTIIDGYSK